MNNLYAIYGTGGCARSVMPLLKNKVKNKDSSNSRSICYIDDNKNSDLINDTKVISFKNLLELKSSYKKIFISIAIADPKIRIKLYKRIKENNFEFLNLKSSNALIMDDVSIGEGFIISPFVTLTSNIRIGKCFHANLYSYVEHDCQIGNFVTFAPGVKCNGNVVIEDNVFVGSGAIIKNGTDKNKIVIGSGSIIGAGSIILNNVKKNTTVVGNNGRIISDRN